MCIVRENVRVRERQKDGERHIWGNTTLLRFVWTSSHHRWHLSRSINGNKTHSVRFVLYGKQKRRGEGVEKARSQIPKATQTQHHKLERSSQGVKYTPSVKRFDSVNRRTCSSENRAGSSGIRKASN